MRRNSPPVNLISMIKKHCYDLMNGPINYQEIQCDRTGKRIAASPVGQKTAAVLRRAFPLVDF